ncbi:spondin domain-containing protein [Haloarchaeobius litoreus]|uniref:Spondin domain-containing protein n=1 Tax=Haloarchaeobius litoreus TaxID=755306 RepID=A0ABD6DJR4_9EURY|nr:spondin domain-containing protein [Haloarchaeobius litoreus]
MTTDDSGLSMNRRTALTAAGATLGGLALGGISLTGAQGGGNQPARTYRVTVSNLTPGQPFTPPLVAAHRPDVEVFAVGDQANEPTQALAENGNLGPLVDLADSTNSIRDAAVGGSPLVPEDDPGETGLPYYDTVHLTTDASGAYLTFASMLIATNDGITGLDTVPLPEAVNESRTYYANGYDVGTERNTELFEDLVPPAKTLIVGGEPEGTTESDPELTENDVIRPHPGIQGDGDLDPAVYGWREPAAMVQVERLEGLQAEFGATLRGSNEVPPVDTDATGEATFELNGNGDELDYEVTVENIEDVVAAHIHCAPHDANGPVGVTLFEGGPESSDGTLAEGTITEPDDENGCGWESLDDVLTALRGDHTYVNVHTAANPAGEIRGQVV